MIFSWPHEQTKEKTPDWQIVNLINHFCYIENKSIIIEYCTKYNNLFLFFLLLIYCTYVLFLRHSTSNRSLASPGQWTSSWQHHKLCSYDLFARIISLFFLCCVSAEYVKKEEVFYCSPNKWLCVALSYCSTTCYWCCNKFT